MCAPSITAGLLSCRHIHRSAAHPPGAHPEAVWVSERAREGGRSGRLLLLQLLSFYDFLHSLQTGHYFVLLCLFIIFLFLTNTPSRKYTSVSVSTCKPRRSSISILEFCFFFSARAVRDLMGKHWQEVKGPVLCLLLKVDQFGSRPSLSIFWDPST